MSEYTTLWLQCPVCDRWVRRRRMSGKAPGKSDVNNIVPEHISDVTGDTCKLHLRKVAKAARVVSNTERMAGC